MKKSPLRILSTAGARDRRGLSRRQAVQRLLGGAGAGLALPGALSAHPAHERLISNPALADAGASAADAAWQPAFFDAHQNETFLALAELIVPNSAEAQVNRFVDTLISVDTPENQKKLIASLGAFDHEAVSRYQQPFKDLSEDQQVAILTAAAAAEPGQPGQGRRRRRRPAVPATNGSEPPVLTLRDHFEDVKGWVSGAFYSSEFGMKELGWTGQVAWDSYPGCEHPDSHK